MSQIALSTSTKKVKKTVVTVVKVVQPLHTKIMQPLFFFGKCNFTHLTIDVMFSGQHFAILAMFIPSWSTKHQCLVDNLLYQPHLYLPPLLGFLKGFEYFWEFGEPHPIYGDLWI